MIGEPKERKKKMKKVLVIGGTGAMGVYVVPKLCDLGYEVDVISMDRVESTRPNLRYMTLDGKDPSVMSEILKNGYDGVVDFMIYNDIKTFPDIAEMYLDSTDHYMFFSTYRVFANEEHPIVESSPRLLDASKDEALLASDDYSIYKAQSENYLRSTDHKNWTILRPAITYSSKRCQLITYERNRILPFIRSGEPIPLFDQALSVHGTMSWAGDVGEMIARLLFNDKALCEDFNLTTSEHHTWGEVADIYHDIFGLNYVPCNEQTYLDIVWPNVPEIVRYRQLWLDRMYDRIMDNTKVLTATGMKQSELKSLYDGLSLEKDSILSD